MSSDPPAEAFDAPPGAEQRAEVEPGSRTDGPHAQAPTLSSASPEGGPEGGPAASPEPPPEGGPAPGPVDDPASHRFECRSCGYVYDPQEGVRKLAIEPGTAFADLDATRFRCPVCRSPVGAFKDIGPRNKPSGFEENLNFGLGVNRLTPGQKNVLIFGGFALAIAFFLSLYSLR